jgi:hypothetical protein
MKFHIPAKKNDRFAPSKLVTQRFTFCENKNYTTKIGFTVGIVELFTLNLMVYVAFLIKRI